MKQLEQEASEKYGCKIKIRSRDIHRYIYILSEIDAAHEAAAESIKLDFVNAAKKVEILKDYSDNKILVYICLNAA